MNDRIKRRIERSRARCEKAATNHKSDKAQEANKHSDKESAPAASQATTS
jgi:hypothetical protein